jgi:hypothetical protein
MNCIPSIQVWPSADSPRGEADGQSFIFPVCAEDATSQHSTCFEINHHNDSGIESTQVNVFSYFYWIILQLLKCFIIG